MTTLTLPDPRWLDGFEIVGIPGRLGGTYDRTTKWKLCLHTTEGSSIEGAVAAYRAKGVPPHVTLDPWARRKVQHIALDRHSLSLRNSEAEDEPVIQVEIVGYAEQTQDWPNSVIDWLADAFAQIQQVCPFDLAYPTIGFGGSEGYGRNGAYRLTMPEWEQFSGIVGHCHSPSPDTHWDPGDFRIDALIEALRQADRNEQPTLIPDQEIIMAAGLTITVPEYIEALFQNYLGRASDPKGRSNYLEKLVTGEHTVESIRAEIAGSAEAKKYAASKQ